MGIKTTPKLNYVTKIRWKTEGSVAKNDKVTQEDSESMLGWQKGTLQKEAKISDVWK
jgi:hypothetical protein